MATLESKQIKPADRATNSHRINERMTSPFMDDPLDGRRFDISTVIATCCIRRDGPPRGAPTASRT
jgi:hypothetical protein